ncbi:MAG TPA: hypothetical protein VK386_10690, partial [Acidimicrobiales bacterium]|nr:hypothetical protein [Acidimicrobiales bacterium]
AMLPDLSAAFSSVYDGGLWVWKDPRTCLTLPLWRRALGDDLAVVLVHRSATAVTTSIHRRDGIPRIYSAGLWLHYLRCSLEGARGLPTVCLDFSDMQRSPEPTTTFLQQALGSLGVGLDGDVVAAAGSIHAPGRPDHGQRGRIDALVRRVTARAAGLLAELPPVSTAFSPPALAEPSWVRPLLFAYRGPWALRARLGHPLGPRFA